MRHVGNGAQVVGFGKPCQPQGNLGGVHPPALVQRLFKRPCAGKEPLLRIFTSDGQLIGTGAVCARIYFGAFPFMALQQAGHSTFVALNYPRYALFFSMLRKIGLVAPLTLLLPNLGLGVYGVFWAELASQVIGASACFMTMTAVIWRPMRRAEPGK